MNRKIILKSRPQGEPLDENFEIREEVVEKIEPGFVMLKTIYLSLDPYMRGRMNAGRSYSKPVELGDVMEGEAVSAHQRDVIQRRTCCRCTAHSAKQTTLPS